MAGPRKKKEDKLEQGMFFQGIPEEHRLKMELQGAKDNFDAIQRQFDMLRETIIQLREENEVLRRELGL